MDHTLLLALRTPIFWILAVASALFLLVNTGLMLYYERVVIAYGGDQNTIYGFLGIVILAGFIFNFVGGYLARKWRPGMLMGVAMFILAGALLALPPARGPALIYVYALGMGISGGIITVIFFSCWGRLFGRTHLGAIQGAAQVLTVIGSAIGPWLLTESLRLGGSYNIFFYIAAPVIAFFGVLCLIAPAPKPAAKRPK
jgi:MFS family permease